MLDDEADGIDIIDVINQLTADELQLVKMLQYVELEAEAQGEQIFDNDEIDY